MPSDRRNIENQILAIARKIRKKIKRTEIVAMSEQLSHLFEQLDIEVLSDELIDGEFAEYP